MDKKEFIKLSSLVDSEFTVQKVYFPKYKMWDNEARRMLVSDRWEKGYRKIYGTETDKGILDLSNTQIGNMLEGVSQAGEASIVGRTFAVKSNGKTGMDIRYYINAKPKDKQENPDGAWQKFGEQVERKKIEAAGLEVETDIPDKVDLSEIPF